MTLYTTTKTSTMWCNCSRAFVTPIHFFISASAGYCFVELSSPAAAVKAITTLNGMLIPGTNKVFKLNWASGGGMASVA
jgi:hypothetical protein